jgi:hypothetical protein
MQISSDICFGIISPSKSAPVPVAKPEQAQGGFRFYTALKNTTHPILALLDVVFTVIQIRNISQSSSGCRIARSAGRSFYPASPPSA